MPVITIQFIKDVVATPEQKRRLVIEMTDKFVEIIGEVTRPFVYCIIQETPQMEWSIAGVPMPDLPYLTGDKHAGVIGRSNDMMRAAIAQMQAQTTEDNVRQHTQSDAHAEAVWRGEV
jgi:4-oxalocrotonate tautomerase family enzyme